LNHWLQSWLFAKLTLVHWSAVISVSLRCQQVVCRINKCNHWTMSQLSWLATQSKLSFLERDCFSWIHLQKWWSTQKMNITARYMICRHFEDSLEHSRGIHYQPHHMGLSFYV
jgi:hypothetical protein